MLRKFIYIMKKVWEAWIKFPRELIRITQLIRFKLLRIRTVNSMPHFAHIYAFRPLPNPRVFAIHISYNTYPNKASMKRVQAKKARKLTRATL
jgi:hypothetical protein